MIKSLFKITLLVLAVGYLCYALVRFSRPDPEALCEGLNLTVRATGKPTPVDTAYLHAYMEQQQLCPVGMRRADVSLTMVDSVILACPYVKSARSSFDGNNRLCVTVIPYEPVMYVIPEGTLGFYLSSDGGELPTDLYCGDLPLASGHITPEWAGRNLVELARLLDSDAFWDDYVAQVYIERDSTATLIPRIDGHVVRLGTLTNLDSKFERLRAFYAHTMNTMGWDTYTELNLAYDNQIVAKRNKKKQ